MTHEEVIMDILQEVTTPLLDCGIWSLGKPEPLWPTIRSLSVLWSCTPDSEYICMLFNISQIFFICFFFLLFKLLYDLNTKGNHYIFWTAVLNDVMNSSTHLALNYSCNQQHNKSKSVPLHAGRETQSYCLGHSTLSMLQRQTETE